MRTGDMAIEIGRCTCKPECETIILQGVTDGKPHAALMMPADAAIELAEKLVNNIAAHFPDVFARSLANSIAKTMRSIGAAVTAPQADGDDGAAPKTSDGEVIQ